MLISQTGNTWIFRYWTTGTYVSGDVTIGFVPGSYGFTDASLSTFVGPVAPINFTVGGVATPNIGYVDVQLTPTAGDTLDLTTILDADAELQFSGAGAGNVAPLAAATPTQLPGTSTFRYYVTGSFAPGAVDVTILGGSFASTHDGTGDRQPRRHAALHDPAADRLARRPGRRLDRNHRPAEPAQLLRRHLHRPGLRLDARHLVGDRPRSRVHGRARHRGRHAHDRARRDAARRCSFVAQSGNTYTFRYFYTGTLQSGSVKLTFIGGSVNYLDQGSNVIPLFAPRSVTVMHDPDPQAPAGQLVVDVPFGETGALDDSTFTDATPDVSIAGATLTLKQLHSPGVYRYVITGTGLADGPHRRVRDDDADVLDGDLDVHGRHGAHRRCRRPAAHGRGLGRHLHRGALRDGRRRHSRRRLDHRPHSGADAQRQRPRHGRARRDQRPSILADGQTVRYYLTGEFAPGVVTVGFLAGSWADTAGNPGTAGTQSFKLVQPLPAPTAGQTPDKVFFIDISGGMQLWFVPLVSDQPVLEIRGKVTLEFGNRTLPDGSTKFRFTIDASGTIDVYKIGNIASGAAAFVLEVGDSFSDSSFWGVAAFATNFDFLQPYGIDLRGSAMLQINTSNRVQTETISLEGIPGGVIFALPVAANAGLLAALPTDTFNPIALPSGWTTAFSPAGLTTDRDADGIAGAADATQAVTLNSGQVFKLENFGGLTLLNATIEGIVSGKEWRIKNGDGKQFFVNRETDVNGNDILVVRGEARTYELAPQSFEVEVVGGLTIKDPTTTGEFATRPEWFHMDGGFLLRITRERGRLLHHRRREHHPAAPRRPHHGPADRARASDHARRTICRPRGPAPARHLGRYRAENAGRRTQQPVGHHQHLRLPRTRSGDAEHDAAGSRLHGSGRVPQRPADRLPDHDQDLQVRPVARRTLRARRGAQPERRLLRLGADRGLDHPPERADAVRLRRDHARGRRPVARPHLGRREHLDRVRRLLLGLDRLHLLRRPRRPRGRHQPRHRRPRLARAHGRHRHSGPHDVGRGAARGQPVPLRRHGIDDLDVS